MKNISTSEPFESTFMNETKTFNYIENDDVVVLNGVVYLAKEDNGTEMIGGLELPKRQFILKSVSGAEPLIVKLKIYKALKGTNNDPASNT